jgi:CheY-like chemotaxis protein
MRVRIVLVVDDDECIRTLYGNALREAGLTVVEAATVASALEQAAAAGPDAIVLDREMPDGDGFAVAQTLARGRAGQVPILGFSAHAGAREASRAAGCDAFLAKPCATAALVAGVLGLLEEPDDDVRSA